MAAHFGMGVWTFNRHLRRTVNRSAYALVQEKRLERAKHLVRAGKLPLKEIAASWVFRSGAYEAHVPEGAWRHAGAVPQGHLMGFPAGAVGEGAPPDRHGVAAPRPPCTRERGVKPLISFNNKK